MYNVSQSQELQTLYLVNVLCCTINCGLYMNTALTLHVTKGSSGMFLHVMSSTWLRMGLEGRLGYEAMCITGGYCDGTFHPPTHHDTNALFTWFHGYICIYRIPIWQLQSPCVLVIGMDGYSSCSQFTH